MKLFRKYLIFNLSFFLIHLVLQNIFKQFINSNYLLLLLEFSLFAFIFTKFLSKKERIVILFSLSNLVIYLFFIWVIEKSLSIDF